jgi:hypothetical protein
MPARREEVGVRMLIQPEVDPAASAKALKSATDLYKKVARMKVEFAGVAKASTRTLREIQGITRAAGEFSKKLGSAAQESFKKLQGLGNQLEDAHAQAEALEQSYRSAKGAKAKGQIQQAQAQQLKVIQDLNKQIDEQRKSSKEYGAQLNKIVQKQRGYQKTLESAAKFGPGDMFKGIAGGIGKMLTGGTAGVKAGLADIVGSMGKGAIGAHGRAGVAEGVGADRMASMAKAAKGAALAAAAVAALVQLFLKATSHAAMLNKAMLEGATTAGDSAMTAKQYTAALNQLRDAAIGAAGDMLKFGMDSEQSLKAVAAFSRESSGSIGQTAARLKDLGKGSLQTGLLEFSKMAAVYGKALGMEATEVGTMMGTFVSEVGYGAESAQEAMSGIVREAAAANMPVYKFMDIFRQTIPSLDMYTNRMEELTGVIKLLSKTMSAKDVKKFMEAFGEGFDQVDFKQRLKLALTAGVGNVTKILQKDFKQAGQRLEKEFDAAGLGKQFADALKSRDPVKAMSKVVAKGMAAGMNEAAIGAAQKLARSQRLLQRGGALNVAGAMRGAGMLARLQIAKATSRVGGVGFEGLGEHVIKKLTGWSEKQYSSFLQFEDNMGAWTEQLQDVGRTSSKQMNENLKRILGINKEGVEGDEDLEKQMKKVAKQDPKKAQEMVQQAMMMQIDEEKKMETVQEDLAKAQVDATLSVVEKIENVIGFLLEKLYWVMNEVFGFLSTDLWGWVTGNDAQQEVNKHLKSINDGFKESHKGDEQAVAAQKESIDKLQKLNASNADMNKILLESRGLLDYLGESPKLMDDLVKQGAFGSGAGERANANVMQSLLLKRDKGEQWSAQEEEAWDDATSKLDPKKMISALGVVATSKAGWEAKGPSTVGVGRGKWKAEEARKKLGGLKTAGEYAEEKSDWDKRTLDKYQDIDNKMIKAGEKAVKAAKPEAAKAKAAPGAPAGVTPFVNPYLQPEDTGFGSPAFMKKVAAGGPAGGPPATAKDTQEQTDAQTSAVTEATADAGEKTQEVIKDVYDGIEDVAGILKKGIRWESGFLRTWEGVLKSGTLASFRTALMEHAVLMAKIQTQQDFAQKLGEKAWQVMEAGVDTWQLGAAGAGELDLKIQEARKGHQAGGAIPQTGDYTLHRGEAVLDAMTYESVKRGLREGGAGGGTVVNVTINGSDLSMQQLEGAIYGVIDRVKRRH